MHLGLANKNLLAYLEADKGIGNRGPDSEMSDCYPDLGDWSSETPGIDEVLARFHPALEIY